MKVIRINVSEEEKALLDLLRQYGTANTVFGQIAAPLPKVTVVTTKTWASKKDRKAGRGFACTIAGADNCGRKDLRTAHNTGSHDPSTAHFHFANKGI